MKNLFSSLLPLLVLVSSPLFADTITVTTLTDEDDGVLDSATGDVTELDLGSADMATPTVRPLPSVVLLKHSYAFAVRHPRNDSKPGKIESKSAQQT